MAMHYVYILESLTVPGHSTSAPSKTFAVVRPWPDEGGQNGYALRLHSRIAHCSWPLYIGSIEDLRRSPALAGRRRTKWLCTTFTFSNRSLFLATLHRLHRRPSP